MLNSGCQQKGKATGHDNTLDTESARPTTFSALGDVPYVADEFESLLQGIAAHNQESSSLFLIHLGDIKTSAEPCDENRYKKVADILKESSTPTFIIPGDNEYNDCEDPITAFSYWKKNFLRFHENWNFHGNINYDDTRNENYSWLRKDVLFIAINLVGGRVHDSLEWKARLSQNADWVEKSINHYKAKANAVVLFGHAYIDEDIEGKFSLFTDRFRKVAKDYGKPVLYLHGDGHVFVHDRPWPEKNILQVQVDAGVRFLEITVDTKREEVFYFNKDFI